jgi:hypothetical protein
MPAGIAPVAGIHQFLFFAKRATNRFVESDQRLGDELAKGAIVSQQIVL